MSVTHAINALCALAEFESTLLAAEAEGGGINDNMIAMYKDAGVLELGVTTDLVGSSCDD